MCWALPASALLIRADRDDAEYLELASRYASSVALNAPGGEGVLIAPRWLLTSAESARALRDSRPPAKIAFGSRPYEVQAIFIHPEWRSGGEADIALVYLKEAVRGIEPSRLYREGDEAGRGVVIAGSGPTGRIGDGLPPRADGRKRAAINTVDRVTPRSLELRIKPYYLHHGDLAAGTAHLRTTIPEGQELMRRLRGRVSGLCQPEYVLDIPGGHGKAPIGPNYLSHPSSGECDLSSKTQYRIADYCGDIHLYPPKPRPR